MQNNIHIRAIVTWVVVYPIITALLFVLDPKLSGVPLAIRTLVLTAIMVPLMVYLLMPLAFRALFAVQRQSPNRPPHEPEFPHRPPARAHS